MTFVRSTNSEGGAHSLGAFSYRPIHENIPPLSAAHETPTPISQLPAELLILVFKDVQISGRTTRSGSSLKSYFMEDKWKEIIVVSHVCHSWRSIALSCPSYWSRIIFSNFLVAEEMLSRTKSSPISVVIDKHHRDSIILFSPSFLARLIDTARLRELHLFLPIAHLHYLLDGVSGRSFPFLQSLHIEVLGADLWAPAFQMLSLPMPHVHHIGLFRCPAPWGTMGNCTSLVSLELDGDGSEHKPSRRQFFDVLASNPNLERVLFCSTLPEPSNDPILPVNLPKLSSCMVTGATILESVDFQAHVVYPINMSEILFGPIETGSADVSAVEALVSSYGVSTKHSPRTCMLFKEDAERDLSVIFAPTVTALSDYHTVHHTFRNHTATIEVKRENMSPRSLVQLLSIPRLEELVIIAEPRSCPSDVWLGFFQRHPEIRTLAFAFWAAQPVLTALLTHTVVPDDSSEERGLDQHQASPPAGDITLCLPHLESLEIDCSDTDGVIDLKEIIDGNLLYQCLSERRKCGLKIDRLDIGLTLSEATEVDLNVQALKEEVNALTRYGIDWDDLEDIDSDDARLCDGDSNEEDSDEDEELD